MGYPPVVVVDSGGVPRTQVAEGVSAPAYTVVESGARPITLTTNAPPIALFNEDGSHYIAGPPAILGSSLIAWWTADRADLITLNGSAVTSWRDVVAGYDAVQAVSASRPTYSATSFNNAPGLSFDGADDELTCTSAGLLAALPDGAEPCEIWNIVQQTVAPADVLIRRILTYGDSINISRAVSRVVQTGVNRAQVLTGTGAANVTARNDNVDFSSRHVLRSIISATGNEVEADNVDGSAGVAVPATGPVARLRHGANASGTASNFFGGLIRDSFVVAGNITAEQETALLAWALPRRML